MAKTERRARPEEAARPKSAKTRGRETKKGRERGDGRPRGRGAGGREAGKKKGTRLVHGQRLRRRCCCWGASKGV